MKIRSVLAPCGVLMLAACDAGSFGTTPGVPEGPKIEIVEAFRTGGTTTVAMRYKNGGAIAVEDEERAALRAASIACRDDESPIVDTRTREADILKVNIFCVGLRTTDEVIDGSGLKV